LSVTDGTYAEADNWPAIAALVCGVLSYVTPLAIIAAPLAVFFGVDGRRRARAGAPYGGLATAGVVLGAIGIAVAVLFFVLFLFFALGSSQPVVG
jgi:hypothetical protein